MRRGRHVDGRGRPLAVARYNGARLVPTGDVVRPAVGRTTRSGFCIGHIEKENYTLCANERMARSCAYEFVSVQQSGERGFILSRTDFSAFRSTGFVR